MAFITKIAEYIKDNYDLTKDNLTVIFPNKRAAFMLREKLKETYKKQNVWLPQMISIQEAMSNWSKIQLIDNINVTFELLEIINESGDLSNNSNLYSLSSQIVKDFDEIDQYAVNANDLFKYLKSVKDIETWNPSKSRTATEESYLRFFSSLHSYYTKLREKLLQNNCGYYGMITRKLYELGDKDLHSLADDKYILFAGFNAMTTTEENIITRLVESGRAVLLWDLDEYYFKDTKQEAGLFARDFFKKHKNLPINFLSDEILAGEKEINVIAVSGSAIQANALQLQLHNECNNKNKKTIILSDESILIPVLNSIPSHYEKINITMGYPFSKTVINQFILQLFSFQNNKRSYEEKIYFWSLKKMLESELFKIIFSQNELYSINKLIRQYLKQSTYYTTIKEIEVLLPNNNEARLLSFIRLISGKWKSVEECISALKSILMSINDMLPIENDSYFIRNQVSACGRIVNKIERLSRKHNILLQIHNVEQLYRQTSNELTIKMKSQGDGLQIMGLLETRNLDFEEIHILSVNEGILPQNKNSNSLIPHDLRIEYKLPVYKNKQAVYAYHFYRILQSAKKINIYYNTLADGMGEGEASRFILQIINEIPLKNPNIKISNITYKNPDVTVKDTVRLEVDKANIIDKIKNKLHGINNKGGLTGLSPTSISCYLRCPMQFYLKYIENIQDHTAEELIQSNVIGSIIHSTFEFLYSKFDKNIIDYKLYNEFVSRHLNESFEKALIENNFTNGLPETGFNYLTQIMIKELINNFINYEKNFLEKSNTLEIIGLEKNLSYNFNIDGTDITLMGFADRIDKTNDTIRILDYKTGSINDKDVEIKKDNNELKDLSEKSLQLLIYKYLYSKNNPNVPLENIESGIFGLLRMNQITFPLVNYSTTFDNENFMKNCDILFENLFREILNTDIPFTQTDNESNCKNCDFKSVCKRKPKSYY